MEDSLDPVAAYMLHGFFAGDDPSSQGYVAGYSYMWEERRPFFLHEGTGIKVLAWPLEAFPEMLHESPPPSSPKNKRNAAQPLQPVPRFHFTTKFGLESIMQPGRAAQDLSRSMVNFDSCHHAGMRFAKQVSCDRRGPAQHSESTLAELVRPDSSVPSCTDDTNIEYAIVFLGPEDAFEILEEQTLLETSLQQDRDGTQFHDFVFQAIAPPPPPQKWSPEEQMELYMSLQQPTGQQEAEGEGQVGTELPMKQIEIVTEKALQSVVTNLLPGLEKRLAACNRRYEDADDPVIVDTRWLVSVVLQNQGDFQRACAELSFVAESRVRRELLRLGPDHSETIHPETLVAREELVRCKRRGGDITGALVALQSILEQKKRLLGADHPSTLESQYERALCKKESGDVKGALLLIEAVSGMQAEVLGGDHPSTLTSMQLHAQCKRRLGDAWDNLVFMKGVADARASVLGAMHPDTLASKRELAICRRKAGDIKGALALIGAVVEAEVCLYGESHASTFASKRELALCKRKNADVEGCIAILETVVRAKSRMPDLLSGDHPSTPTSKGERTSCRKDPDDVTAALVLKQAEAEAHVRVLGESHQSTLTCQHEVALCKQESGDIAGALTLLEAVVDAESCSLGPLHPDTLASSHALAVCRRKSGDLAGAMSTFEDVLDSKIHSLGPGNLSTALSQRELALCKRECNDIQGAKRLLESVVERYESLLGADHLLTLISKQELARCMRDSGDAWNALLLMESVLKSETAILGDEHPQTLTSMHALALCKKALGDFVGASKTLEAVAGTKSCVFGEDHPTTPASKDALSNRQALVKPKTGLYLQHVSLDMLRGEVPIEDGPPSYM
eukprot:TRINITY_DN27575_c0_g1_i1.p1 TRINITY_DN27575_c0_g1~~TRINITY_DN27575_c0_g1_i1.p1  ORF type:complete len:851 (+),score=157.61 TRINITY_DN27575_c0_g1_i1:44-2596(+)